MFAISLIASKIPSPVVAHAAWMYHFRDVSLRKVIKSATSEGFSASAITKLKKKKQSKFQQMISQLLYLDTWYMYMYVQNLFQINMVHQKVLGFL